MESMGAVVVVLCGGWLSFSVCGYVMCSASFREEEINWIVIMAWSCSGLTNAELISNLLRNNLINSDTVAAVRPPPRLNARTIHSLTTTFSPTMLLSRR